MRHCLTSVRFNMTATVLDFAPAAGDVTDAVIGGQWKMIQDEDTGAMTRVWVEDQAVPPKFEELEKIAIPRFDIECYVRGFPEVGFRSSANTESFLNGEYKPFEAIQMVFPAKYMLNRRNYITAIRGRNKQMLWVEEESGNPTVFEIQGVTPTFDPFGKHIDNLAVLKRATVQ